MTDPKALLVTMNAADLSQLIRSEVRAALADRGPLVANAPPVLTSEEAAAFLKMPVGVLRKRVRDGEVPSFKIGKVLRFRVTELEAWLDALQNKKAG